MRAFACYLFLIWLAPMPIAKPVSAAPAPEESGQSSGSVAELVADLSSRNFEVRRRATDALLRSGAEAVDPLMNAAATGAPEVQHRAVEILRRLLVTKQPETYDPAETALETLADSSNLALAGRARQVLRSHQSLRAERAIQRIRELGGIVEYVRADAFGGLNGPQNGPHPTQRVINHIVLSSRWKGGDEGLKYVRRVSRVPRLYVAKSGKSSPVSQEALERLQASLPHMEIEERSFAYLGIGGSRTPHRQGCVVEQVKPGTAAERGGIREFDVITHFGGGRVRDFESLIDLIKQYAPGDKVEVKVLRGTQTETLEVTLGEWKASE